MSVRYRVPQERVLTFKEYLIRWLRGRMVFEELHALSQVNLTVGRGEAIGIIGRNGAGKTTLMKVIARVLRPSSGSVRGARHGRAPRARRRLRHRADRARERVPERRRAGPLAPRDAAPASGHRPLRGARALHRCAAADLLDGDARATGVRGGDGPAAGDPPGRRDPLGGRHRVPAEVHRAHGGVPRARRHARARVARRPSRSATCVSEPCGCTRARWFSTGRPRRWSTPSWGTRPPDTLSPRRSDAAAASGGHDAGGRGPAWLPCRRGCAPVLGATDGRRLYEPWHTRGSGRLP